MEAQQNQRTRKQSIAAISFLDLNNNVVEAATNLEEKMGGSALDTSREAFQSVDSNYN